jgi:endoglucanase
MSLPSILRRSSVLAIVLIALSPALFAQNTTDNTPSPAGPSILTNADFSTASADPLWPEGWDHDKAQPVTWEKDSEGRFMRLTSQSPGQSVKLTRTVPISSDVKGLVLGVRFRIANFAFGTNGSGAPSFGKDIHFDYRFLDAQGQPVKGGGGFVLDSHAKTWTHVSRRFLVPAGAASLQLIPCIREAKSGTLELDRITLSAMSPAEAEALIQAPAVAAQKKTEDDAEIPKMLALPAKTAALKVSGNKLVTAAGKTVVLQGVNVCSLEWSEKGEHIFPSMRLSLKDWGANAIRLPVYDGFWFGTGKPPKIPSNDADAYRKIVDDVIKMAAGQGAYVILDLHRFGIPEERDIAFWKDAAARYKDNPAVLFDVFNEPGGIKWEIWRNGGDMQWKKKKNEEVAPTVHSVGMQALVDAVRSTGAKNIVVAGGIGSAYDLSGVLDGFALDDKGGNGIMYATHFYNWHGGWEKHFLPLAAKYPILVGEFGADTQKMGFIPANKQEDPNTWMPDALALIQKYNLSWTAFCLHPKSTPRLISNWDYEPTPFFGSFVKDALAGKKFELKKMR